MKIVKLSELQDEKSSHGTFSKKVMIGDGVIPYIYRFAQVVLQSGDVAGRHGHDGMYEVFFVEQGKMKIVFDDKKEHILEKGACIVTEPHETHEVSNPFPEPLVLTYFQSKV
jgi:mannose-6-phosphate isomerase-like protein (cupin superfamily)